MTHELFDKSKSFLLQHIIKIIVGALFVFLLNHWIGTMQKSNATVAASNKQLTASHAELKYSVDSLRWQLNDIDSDFLKWLEDHEQRLRALEEK